MMGDLWFPGSYSPTLSFSVSFSHPPPSQGLEEDISLSSSLVLCFALAVNIC